MTARQQRAPIVLGASVDAVLATLESADKAGPKGWHVHE
jgi:hypothetical protein